MANLLAYGTQIVGGGNSPSTGGGHVIENASGTDLAQRDTLQFVGGLKTTDDSTNGKTVVDDSPIEMTWTQWNTLTPAEQQALPKVLITDAPGVDGPINVDLIKTLWTNPNPTSAFAAQNINLLNNDYDLLIFVGYYSTSYTAWLISSTCNKGHGTILHFSYNGTDFLRTVTRVSDSSFNIADGQKGYGQTVEIDNTVCVPIAIYGIKSSVTVDVSGVISDVSTSADKCMMSDGVTSVQSALTATPITFTPASSSITLDWGSFDKLSNLILSNFGFYVNTSVTAGTNLTLGSLNCTFASNVSVPVYNSFGSTEYLGIVLFYWNGNVDFVPAVTKTGEMRISGMLISKLS